MDPYLLEREKNILNLEKELKRSTDMSVMNHHYQHQNDCPSIDSGSSTSSSSSRVSSPTLQCMAMQPRIRRYSATLSPNFSPLNSPGSYSNKSCRINQLKQEEGMDMLFREVAHERETQSTLRIYSSWEDLTLDEPSDDRSQRKSRLTDPLHLAISSLSNSLPVSNSPSPTRRGRQCFSPSMQAAVRTGFSPSPSPSPTRKTFTTRRSSSPISLRPSALGPVKRRCDLDVDKPSLSSPKKARLVHLATDSASYVGMQHPLYQNISVSSGCQNSHPTSPFSSLDSTGTPESINSVDSPNLFKPVEDSNFVDSDEPNTSCVMNDDSMFDGPMNLSNTNNDDSPMVPTSDSCCASAKADSVDMEVSCSVNPANTDSGKVIEEDSSSEKDSEITPLMHTNLVSKALLRRSHSAPMNSMPYLSDLSKFSTKDTNKQSDVMTANDSSTEMKEAL